MYGQEYLEWCERKEAKSASNTYTEYLIELFTKSVGDYRDDVRFILEELSALASTKHRPRDVLNLISNLNAQMFTAEAALLAGLKACGEVARKGRD